MNMQVTVLPSLMRKDLPVPVTLRTAGNVCGALGVLKDLRAFLLAGVCGTDTAETLLVADVSEPTGVAELFVKVLAQMTVAKQESRRRAPPCQALLPSKCRSTSMIF